MLGIDDAPGVELGCYVVDLASRRHHLGIDGQVLLQSVELSPGLCMLGLRPETPEPAVHGQIAADVLFGD